MRRTLATGALVLLALVGAACVPAGGSGGGGGSTFKFRATEVKVVNHNDTFLYGNRDEVFAYNLWFRVKYASPNSAQVGLAGSRDHAFNDLGDGQSLRYTGSQMAEVDFPNVRRLDVLDLLNTNNKLEILGNWTWAMDRDDISVAGVAGDVLSVLRDALNQTIAVGALPEDPNFLVDLITDDIGRALSLVAGALFASIPGLPDDVVGSRIYVGVAATGTLSQIIDAAVGPSIIPPVEIPIISVPPDIAGGEVFSLGHNNTFKNQVMNQDGRHDYEIQVLDAATINQAPFANFSVTPTSGTAPLAVSFNAGGSVDPDGSIVSYNWNFGDFTTGSGVINSHVFTSSGNFPVTLTVTDDDGASAARTINVAVGGAPTVAPTGLQLVGSGCCDTYGDFAWNMVPGAEAYEIQMDGYFLGGCVTDHGAVLSGQRSSGRVQAFGLCLGSNYDVRIRARANGLWGPWSSTTNVTL